MTGKLKDTVYRLLEAPADNDIVRKCVIYFLFVLITLNVLIVLLETEHDFYLQYQNIFFWLTLISVGIFTIEYLLRIWICTKNPLYQSPIKGRLRYAITPLALFDLLAILPFYIPFLLPFDLRVLRIFRLTRVFTVLKMGRFSHAWDTFAFVVRTKKEELIIAGIIIFMVLTISSSAMYYIEHDAQPEKFSSIPDAMWWGVVTLSTVGYGDVYPITPVGKIIGAIVALSGIALFALPAGILVAGLVESIQLRHNSQNTCEHEQHKEK
jgi:voltage-gated potassium channel